MTFDCPSCAAPNQAGPGVCSACGRALSVRAAVDRSPVPAAQIPAAGIPAPFRGSEDARRDERFELPTDVVLRKVGPDGAPEKEERTIAHDLSRSGMRVLTSWSDLAEGDQVSVQEVGGGFSTGAVVRHVRRGTDRITRAGIEFVENEAPTRLVGTTTGIKRPVFGSVQHSARPSGRTPEAVSPSGPSSPSRTLATPRPVSRPAVTTRPAITPPPRDEGLKPAVPAPAPRSAESVQEEVATARAAARDLVGESKVWEALECLARAQNLTAGTPEAGAIRIQIWETQAKVPSLMRAAQQNLEELARSEPRNAGAHSALGRIYFAAGLSARARMAFQQVLAIEPLNREATAALAALNDPARRR